MIKNKVFILFREKLVIITLFLFFIPYFSYGKSPTTYGDQTRYILTQNFLPEEYASNTVYLPYCGDIGESIYGKIWLNYPSADLPENFNNKYPICLKLRYCSDTYIDENGDRKLYFPTPGYDKNGNPELNCYRKSCLDLTNEELETIYLQTYGIDNIKYNFCNPYKYKNKSVINSLGNSTSIGMISDEYVYCHEFAEQDLDYLIPNIRGLKDRAGNDLFQCMIHQCPPSSSDSLTCYTNFWLFGYRDTNDNNKIIRSENYQQKYIEKLFVSSNSSNNYSVLTSTCSSIYCQKYRRSNQLECNTVLNSMCDTYTGIDKNFENTTIGKNATINNIVKNYLVNPQRCVAGFCQQTVDCALSQNNLDPLCGAINQDATNNDEPDNFLSYFYRPFPSQTSTEILAIKRDSISNGNNLANTIYSTRYDLQDYYGIYNLSSNNVDTDLMLVTVIKRLMRGVPVKPLPAQPGKILQATRNTAGPFHTKYIDLKFDNTNNSSYLKDYFNYIKNGIYTSNRDNICFANVNDFKTYGFRQVHSNRVHNLFWWEEGDYYFSRNNNAKDFMTLYSNALSIPICENANNLSHSVQDNSGRRALCNIEVDHTNLTPRTDGYYIKGTPIFNWSANKAEIESVEVEVCLRVSSYYEGTKLCGARECVITCADNNCNTMKQVCGIDKCVTLKWNREGPDCTMDAVEADMNNAETDPNKKLTCYKVVTENGKNNKVRFRINKINGKLYVFVDASKSSGGDTEFMKSVLSESKITLNSSGDIFNNQNYSITEYKGKLVGENLLDDNNLKNWVDENQDGINTNYEYITDEDVFGEELHNIFRCGENDATKNPICTEMSIGSKYTSNDKWIVWDIVQYIGNNQPQYVINEDGQKINNPNCRVGYLQNCRGYYDAQGNFFKESQGIPLPLAASPNKFYKYATTLNSQNLFLPLLKIYSAYVYDTITNNLINKTLTDTQEDQSLEVDFFKPTMTVIFEYVQDTNTIPFDKTEISRTISDSQKKYEIEYILRKTTEKGSEIVPKVCLIRPLGFDANKNPVESVIMCIKRKKPDLNSILISMGKDTNSFKPYLNVYFIDNDKIDKTKNINLNNSNSIQFKNVSSNAPTDKEEKLKLPPNSKAEAHTYPITVEASYCSELHYDCINYKKQLIIEKRKLETINKDESPEALTEYNAITANITQLTNKVSRCENTVKTYCDNITSGIYSLKTIRGYNGDKIYNIGNQKRANIAHIYHSNYVKIRMCLINNNCSNELKNIINIYNQEVKAGHVIYNVENNIPVNYNTIGAENNLCIVSGFDTYFPNVIAIKSTGTTLGKCILNTESKKNPNCRRTHYYTYCTDNNDPNCICLNGTAECNCAYGDVCVKKNSCECSGVDGATNSCTNLPEECYLPGTNGYKILLKDGNQINTVCSCEYAADTTIVTTGKEIRKATPTELGLCAEATTIPICQPIKYYDSNKNYSDGGIGEKLSVIQEKYKSNIWRTNETKEDKIKNDSMGHAEFDMSRPYIEDSFNIESLYCHNPNTGHYYILDETSDSCQDGYVEIYATEGECKGFWKNKTVLSNDGTYDTINPLATCTLNANFILANNTNCERYSCPAVNENDSNYVKSEEKYTLNTNEINSTNANKKGLSHGYANWAEYKKGTYSIDGIPLNNGIENGHGDDIEQRTAESCIYGYVPAGFSKIINKYYPVKVDNSASDGVLYFDKFVKNMLLENQDYISASDMIINLNYNAKDHLPVRYCNQVGQWMPVDDIYTKYKINLYNLNSAPFHDLDNDGYVKIDTYKNMLYPNIETNTYGVSVDYSKKYCERSFCKEISTNDVPLYLDDEHNTEVNLAGNETDPTSPFSRFLGLDDDYNVGYFANEDTINAYTVWRHTGGATWQETPGPLSDNDIRNVIGSCDASKHFYPHNAIFLQDSFTNMDNQKISYSSFEKQYNNLFSATNISISSIIKPELKKFFENTTLIQHPTRRCNKYGVWGAIENECEKACEPLDPFRTNFTYEGSGNNLKVTVLGLYKTPHLRNDYYKEIDANTKVGDIYTGGARWGRTLAGQYAIGECDSTIKTNMQIYNTNGQLVNSNQSITFISNGSKNDVIPGTTIKIGGRPYRECLPDGTWGPVHNPCRLYNACPSLNVYNADLSQYSSAVVKREIVGSLNSSSILFEDIFNNTNLVRVTSECDKRYYEEGGTISKNCIIQTQQWDSNSLNNSCILKVCPSYNKKIGNVEIINIDSSRELYYPKNSGYSGEIILNNRSYKGYSVNRFCPNLFECIDCEDTSTVKYTCVYDEDTNDLIWESTGRCEPRSCSFNALVSKCNQLGSCVPKQEILSPGDLTIIPPENSFSNIVFENNKKYNDDKSKFAIGSRVALLPKTNYKNNMKTYAYCDERGEWNIVGGFEPITCSMNNLEKLEGARWEKEYSTSCNNSNSNTVCHGTIEKVVCDSPTTTVGTRTAKCVVINNVAEWQYTGSVQCVK